MNNTVKAIILAIILEIVFTLIFYFGILRRNQLGTDISIAIVAALPISGIFSIIFYFVLYMYQQERTIANDNLN